ncbi:hypothetical protein, partial [Enterobacter intestinihominis]
MVIFFLLESYFRVLTWVVYYAGFVINAWAAAAAVLGATPGRAGRGGAGAKPAGSNPLEILAEGASGNNAVPVYVT